MIVWVARLVSLLWLQIGEGGLAGADHAFIIPSGASRRYPVNLGLRRRFGVILSAIERIKIVEEAGVDPLDPVHRTL